MKRKMWKHQVVASAYCRREKHPALFMDMRLGKCIVAIRRIKMYRPIGADLRVLIAAPSSALGGWQDEFDAEGEDDVALLTGEKKKRRNLMLEGHKWNLINKEGFIALPEIADQDWDCVLADESTFLKNPQAKVTKFFLRNFRDVPHRWIMTGMPNPEGELEFWCQLAFLDTYAFGCRNFWEFRTQCFWQTPFAYGWDPKPGIRSMIRKTVGKRAHVVRRSDVGMDCKKVYEKRTLVMPTALRKSYQDAEDLFILRKEEVEVDRATYAVEQYQWLRQMCGGYIEHERVWDAKHKEVLSLLNGELKDQHVVIWFNYNQELFDMASDLRGVGIKYGMMYGDMPQKERRVEHKKFQDGQIQVFAIQQAVAQMGMDLSRADTAIYFSSPPGLLARMQTEDRIVHATKKTPLLYIDLLVMDSVDEDLYASLKNKKVRSKMTIDRARKYCIERRDRGKKGTTPRPGDAWYMAKQSNS